MVTLDFLPSSVRWEFKAWPHLYITLSLAVGGGVKHKETNSLRYFYGDFLYDVINNDLSFFFQITSSKQQKTSLHKQQQILQISVKPEAHHLELL